MTADVVIDWALRAVMGAASVLVFILGRERKAVEQHVADQFALRDQQIAGIVRQIDAASELSSKLTSKIQPLLFLDAQMRANAELTLERCRNLDERLKICESVAIRLAKRHEAAG